MAPLGAQPDLDPGQQGANGQVQVYGVYCPGNLRMELGINPGRPASPAIVSSPGLAIWLEISNCHLEAHNRCGVIEGGLVTPSTTLN